MPIQRGMTGIKHRAIGLVAGLLAMTALGSAAATSNRTGTLTTTSAPTFTGILSGQTPVLGASLLNADQLALWYTSKHAAPPNLPNLNNDIKALAQIYLAEGAADGVRGDIAFVQSFIETGAFGFPSYGQIRADFNNFSGMFAFNNRPTGTTCAAETSPSRCFTTPQLGVRYQIQLLRGYADATVTHLSRLIKPPSDRIGLAPWWELFGGQSGKAIWATAPNYGTTILTYYAGALAKNGVNNQCLSYFTGAPTGTVGNGYWVFGSDGAVYPFGTAQNLGDLTKIKLWAPIVSAEVVPDKKGYFLQALDGGLFAIGSAKFKGSLGNVKLWAPVNDFASTPNGRGYRMAASDGGVFNFGNAHFYGSLGGVPLKTPIIGIENTPSGNGYWLSEEGGKIYAFGDAGYFGNIHRTHGIVDIKTTPTGKGYYQLRKDGAIAAFGDAQFLGDQRSCGLAAATHMVVTPTGLGYWIVSKTGSVLAFGDAKALGMPATTSAAVAGFALQG